MATHTYHVVLVDHAFKSGLVCGTHAAKKTALGQAGSMENKPHYRPEVWTHTKLQAHIRKGWNIQA